jgi:LL-diaminopimelate aminotransferase
MHCGPDNDFFPDLQAVPRVDLIYICSPNNPTGAVCTRSQLEELVAFAKKNRSIILFDSAYAAYIQDPELPRSIYEIEGAREVAIEIGSFSKLAGFTGIRLGWTVVPHALKYEGGHSVRSDWNRITTTLFNGASIIAQYGGIASLESDQPCIDYYLENACLIKRALQELGYEVFGGTNAPYLWVRFPGKDSWDVFQQLLEQAQIVSTPGSGFGPGGEGFIRFSSYGKREDILQAIKRLNSIRRQLQNSSAWQKRPFEPFRHPAPEPYSPRVCARGQGFGRFAAGKLAQNHRFFHGLEFCNCLYLLIILEESLFEEFLETL